MLVQLQWLGPPLSHNVQGWTYGEMVSSPSFDAPWFGDKLLPKHEPSRNRWDRRSLCRRIDGRTNGEKGRQRPKAPSFSASRFPAFARPLARARSPAPKPSRASLASTRAVSHRARAVAKPDLETQQQSRSKSKIWRLNLSFKTPCVYSFTVFLSVCEVVDSFFLANGPIGGRRQRLGQDGLWP